MAQILFPQSAAANGYYQKPDITVNPTSVDFGSIQVGSSSSENVTITNYGSANLYIRTIIITGGAGQFTISDGKFCRQPLLPNESANITLTFTPTAAGSQSANLTIYSNDPDEPTVAVSLSGTGTVLPPQPDIDVSPLSINFGSIQVGTMSSGENISVINVGSANLSISNITIDDAQFAIASGNISSQSLASNESANITLTFTPTAAGSQSANLTIYSNDPDEAIVAVSLSGTGTVLPPQPDIDVSPLSINFGSVQVGTPSPSENVTVTNLGNANLDIYTITIDDAQFAIISGNISGQPLLPNGSANITLTFTPTAAGSQSANLTIYSNDPDEAIVAVSLSGTGTVLPPQPDIDVSPLSINFGSVQVGTPSPSENVTVTNLGNANLDIYTITIDDAQFAIISGNISGQPLLPNGSANITLTFTPTAAGSQSANLTIYSNDPDEPTVTVSLTGAGVEPQPDIDVSPLSINFGSVQVGTPSPSENITVTNLGNANLDIYTITIDDAQFAIASGNISSQSLSPNESANITLTFTPAAAGSQSANLTIYSNDPDEPSVAVSLTGTGTVLPPQPDIDVSPLSINFGSVQVGTPSPSENVTVTNLGNANLDIYTITINDAQFAITSGNLSSLSPGASANITLVFTPTSSGVQSATMSIFSNDPDESQVNVSLSGTGTISPGPGPGPGTESEPEPKPELAPPAAEKYFTVDFLGKITRELASIDGRPMKLIEAYSPDGIHLLEIEEGTGATDNASHIMTLIEIREAVAPKLPNNTELVGKAYEFRPSGTIFDKPVRLTLGYNVNELPAQVISIGTAYYTADEGWIYLETESSQVAELGKLSASVNHFTIFAILAKVAVLPEPTPAPAPTPTPAPAPTLTPAPAIPMPAVFKLGSLSITPSVLKIWEKITFIARSGEEVVITFDVANYGGQEGSYKAVLTMNGVTKATEVITLDSGQTRKITFKVTNNELGSYVVQIGDLTGEFVSELWINWWLILGICAILILLGWFIYSRMKKKKLQAKGASTS